MRLKAFSRAALAALALTLVAAAGAKAKNSRDLVLFHDVTLAGSHLASGKYRVQWETHSPGATVTFQQGKSVIATAEGKVVERGKKYMANEVVTAQNPDGSLVVQELRFSGSSEVIVFNN